MPEQWQGEVKEVRDALEKLNTNVDLDITYDHTSQTKDPTNQVDRAWLLERGDITPEEIQNAIENGDTFETQGAYIILDSPKGQTRARIEILPDADAGVIKHEFGHLIDKAGLIPGWAGSKEQHADYLADLLGEDKLKGVLQDDGLRGPPTGKQFSVRLKNPEKNSALMKWFGDSKVVDKDGKPLVVYHGTTHNFEVFSLARGNIENDLGAAFYFSNNADDISANYAGEGPDLTQRIELRAERIELRPKKYL